MFIFGFVFFRRTGAGFFPLNYATFIYCHFLIYFQLCLEVRSNIWFSPKKLFWFVYMGDHNEYLNIERYICLIHFLSL